jgi:WD40 repeat protein
LEVVRDYGKHGNIRSIAITSDDKYIFTSGIEDYGKVIQFSVSDGKMIKHHGQVFEGEGVQSITTTLDNKYLFAGSNRGNLKQINLDLEGQEIVSHYPKIHDNAITCLETTRDSKWLFTGSYDKHV